MTYEEAFEALKARDYRRVIELLDPAIGTSGCESDIVNHAFTLALHHAGEKRRLADIAFRVGQRLVDRDPASAMDYFQRALVAGLDRERARQIGALLETWAGDRTDASSGGAGDARSERSRGGRIRRVAQVVGCLLPGHAPSVYLRSLVRGLKASGVESVIFTTEWASSWFFNPQDAGQSPPGELPALDAEVRVASVEGDFLERAERVARSILGSGCDAALFHAGLDQQITSRVAAFRAAPVQVHVNHGTEMDADLYDGIVHLYRTALERTRFPHRPSRWIPPASDIEARLEGAPTRIRRGEFGEFQTLSATFGELHRISGQDYLGALAEILRRFSSHLHLFAGSGDARQARSYLHAKNVLSQVRFLGRQSDVAQLLPIIDLYIAAFPHSDPDPVLEAMGAGKPALVRADRPGAAYISGAELVGLKELIAPGPVEFVDIADRLIRDADYRDAVGQAVRHRFAEQFRPETLGRRYVEFFEEIQGR